MKLENQLNLQQVNKQRIIYTDRSNTLLQSYFRDINKYKPLEITELNNLIVKAQEGDMKAREKVVNSNLKFVVTIAKQFQNRGIPLMDLIGSGTEGLIKAVEKFDPSRNVKFLSYAVWWIKQAIYTSIYWHSREIRLPVSQHLAVIKILEATNKFIKKNGRIPTTNELHEMTGLREKTIDYLAQFSHNLMSVDDYLGGDEENSQVGDIIPNGDKPIEDEVNKQFINKELCKCMEILSIREHDIIMLYFGLGVPQIPQEEIGNMFGLGKERIRQIKEKALDKMRKRCNLQLKRLI